jgi:hypothetical protein
MELLMIPAPISVRLKDSRYHCERMETDHCPSIDLGI